jgi:hypothetical protein
MTTPLQWTYDLQDAMDVRDYLRQCLADGRNLRASWRTLSDKKNALHQLVEAMGADMDFDAYEEKYWCLWDALAHLNCALAGHTIDVHHLADARDALDRLFAAEERGGDA